MRSVPVETLGATVVRAILERTRIDPALIEDVVFAQSYANGETPCVGRWIALQAELPIEVPGMQLDRRCGGGLQAVITAAMMVQSGAADVVLAGGVESMSNVEYYTTDMRWGTRAGSTRMHDRLERGRERSQPEARFGRISGMIETAENLATSVRHHARAVRRIRCSQPTACRRRLGRRAASTTRSSTSRVPAEKGRAGRLARDEGVRPDTTAQSPANLRPLMQDGTVTAGNSSQQNDAAAACLVVAEDQLARLDLQPLGYLVGWAAAGCDPATMGIGPVPAVKKLFRARAFSFDRIDLVELNEAFACQVLAVLKGWDWNDPEQLNVNGSGISLGHPIGATGVRILATLLYELRGAARFGLETMCFGGGQGLAALFESAVPDYNLPAKRRES